MRKIFYTLALAVVVLYSCDKEEVIVQQASTEETNQDPNNPNPTCFDGIQNGNETGVDCGGNCNPCVSAYDILGNAQKGPFLNGSSILVAELDSLYNATGRSFATQILDNAGSFTLDNLSLESPFATLRVDGFYFNEVCGDQSNAQITLNAISDLSRGAPENLSAPVNLNILTHLEKTRVEFLVANGTDFNVAKTQAQNEILSIFGITPSGAIGPSESLDIANNGEGDAILIALASMFQGFRPESAFSNLMGNLISDMRTDGTLDDTSLGSELLAHAKLLDTVQIRENIEARYASLGTTVDVPEFGSYISNFVNTTAFPDTETVIDYPETGLYGVNILDPDVTSIVTTSGVSLSAVLPTDCISLKIRISRSNGPVCNSGCWTILLNSQLNWSITPYNFTNNTQEFTITGIESDLEMWFVPGEILIEYFENNDTTPTRTKTITIN